MTTGIQHRYAIEDLKVGMYISALDAPSMGCPFPNGGFYIRKREELLELSQYCNFVFVNITRTRVVKELSTTLQMDVMDIPAAVARPKAFRIEQMNRAAKPIPKKRKGRVKRLTLLMLMSYFMYQCLKNLAIIG